MLFREVPYKEWVKENRHLKGIAYIKALNRKLRGHYNYYSAIITAWWGTPIRYGVFTDGRLIVRLSG